MTAYVLFKNNTDCGMNKTIATKTGEVTAFNSATQLAKERRIPAYFYIIFNRDTVNVDQAKVMTNYFGEIPGLGPWLWIFGLED